MADTRCANPAYQLDVDTMMVEYTLYRAIQAQIQFLSSLGTTQSSLANESPRYHEELADVALRLTEIYDTIIKLFNCQHGRGKLSEQSQLNGDLLKFLSLLTLWAQSTNDRFENAILHISTEMQSDLNRDRLINHFFRRRWLRTRQSNVSRELIQIEQPSQRHNLRLSLADHILPKFLHLSEHLLPHFMHLSYRMQPTNAQLSEKWMQLAAGFMLHSAIEVLDAPDVFADGPEVVKLAVEECFAWGYVQRHRFGSDSPLAERILSELRGSIPDTVDKASEEACRRRIRAALILEDDCWEMFYDSGLDGNPAATSNTPHSSGELTDWTRIRQESLDIIWTTFSAMLEEADDERYRPVQWLRNQHRLSNFLIEIANFISVSWGNLHSPEWHGKPVLVQIEEGGIHGLSAAEFEKFKTRAGIRSERLFV